MRKILVWFRDLLLLVMSYVFAYLFNLNENYILLYMLLLVPLADFIYFSLDHVCILIRFVSIITEY